MVAFGDAALTFSSAASTLLTGFPNRFVRTDHPEHCAVALHQRAFALPGKLIQRGKRGCRFGKAPV
jgi:hypothetical protein